MSNANDKDDDEIIVVETQELDASSHDDDDEDDLTPSGDDRSTASEDDGIETDGPSLQERRRLEKKERADRRKKAMERDKIELNFLRSQNDQLERRMAGLEVNAHATQVAGLDAEIRAARAEAAAAERVMAKAIEAKNGADATKALNFRDKALEKAAALEARKAQQQRPAQQAAPTGLSLAAAAKARQFLSEHTWYDPSGADEDSALVLALDNAVTRSGLNPESDDYWEALREKVKKRLPEKFTAPVAPERRKPAGGPQLGSGRTGSTTGGRREVYVSPERIAAMKEAGVWDDPVLRAKYVRRYESYDKENKGKRA